MEHHEWNQMVIVIAVVFALGGAWFIGNGVTGLVISESCCFGPSCPADYQCALTPPSVESPAPVRGWNGVFLGVILIAVAVFFLFALHRRHTGRSHRRT